MAGTITQAYEIMPNSNVSVLTFTCTADANNGSFPSTATSTDITTAIKGLHLVEVRTNPGATAPQAAYDIVLNDADGIDLMGGKLADRSATASEAAAPAIATGVYWPRAIDGALTLVITNNNVNSAVIVVKVFLER